MGLEHYDAFLVFDADNVLDPGYFTAMNRTFSQGYDMITSYRNSKNFGDNWISSGYALWFLRESQFLNGARMKLNTSCAISGTGFLVSSRMIREDGGWEIQPPHRGHPVLHRPHRPGAIRSATARTRCSTTSRPATFRASWNQRLRWTKGFYQVFARYGGALVKGSFPAPQLPVLRHADGYRARHPAHSVVAAVQRRLSAGRPGLRLPPMCWRAPPWVWAAVCSASIVLCWSLALSLCWRNSGRSTVPKPRQLLYLLMFPVFIFTYIPMAVVALRKNVTWKSIPHSILCTPDQICGKK